MSIVCSLRHTALSSFFHPPCLVDVGCNAQSLFPKRPALYPLHPGASRMGRLVASRYPLRLASQRYKVHRLAVHWQVLLLHRNGSTPRGASHFYMYLRSGSLSCVVLVHTPIAVAAVAAIAAAIATAAVQFSCASQGFCLANLSEINTPSVSGYVDCPFCNAMRADVAIPPLLTKRVDVLAQPRSAHGAVEYIHSLQTLCLY